MAAAASQDARAEARWQAVQARRPAADDGFVYAVATTGIFCRPGCASRRPRREHVRFFDTAEAAVAAGFRPCRRCRPDHGAADPQAEAVARARRRLEADPDEPCLADLAAEAGLSPGHFRRVFQARVGLSPKQYAKAVRADRLRAALETGATVTDAIFDAGYGGTARAHADAAAGLGMTASAYRKGGAGEVIDHAQADCRLGRVLVAATPRGLCAVAFGDDDGALVADLRARFPRATLQAGGPAARAVLPTVVRLVAAPEEGGWDGAPDPPPLDLRGTAFQMRVWAELRRIPPGQTRTYAELAAAVGQPSATRAVANACGSNPVAAVVPCHRVVRSDGGLGGYRWGLARKRALLDGEAEADRDDEDWEAGADRG
ncbi:bifunctional DNA-binding transcriptional regulator/O6-methylguanine-DNA methyltransferase Ada [Roseospira navarrensis]|uniref:methylated-DNA--[protein]-cysteine S-methyltransferase n=2 Tax=Roseospira navarrensis TaxID=140058 RepID=A0A7X1ZGB5_9PROT|nr:bifunctional DNA-binding transcriptional regulator/O6-methylguanine-DNA methyltransferase Ada [Roseospira navarrensis]